MKKVLLVDDHEVFSVGVAELVKELLNDVEVIIMNNFHDAISELKVCTKYDLVISDYEISGGSFEEFFIFLKNLSFQLPVIVVSMHKKSSILELCEKLDTAGYVLKNEYEDFMKAVPALLEGRSYFSKSVLAVKAKADYLKGVLSSKEQVVFDAVKDGLTNQEIADQLFMAIATVKTLKKNIKFKLGLESSKDIKKIDV